MVNDVPVPVQVTPALVKVGVTETVAWTGTVAVLLAVKTGMLPTPLAARPMVGWLFVQVKVVPAMLPEKFTGLVDPWWHNTWLNSVVTVGVGYTVMVKDVLVPVHCFPALV
jgi:hypothetical protein